MSDFFYNTDKAKRLATAVCNQDLWQFDTRVFVKGEAYKVTMIQSHSYYIVNSVKKEHLIIKDSWGKHFKIEKT